MSSPSSGISVIICTWNRAASLEMTLESLLPLVQAADFPVEVLVLDNNSSDDTRSRVETQQALWPAESLRYLFEPRQGKQFALNRGIGQACHPVLAFTDDDVLFPAHWLRAIHELFADPDIELAGGRCLVDWSGVDKPDWYREDMLAILGGVDLGVRRLDPAPADFAPGGGNLIARRSTFVRYGLFSELHFRHMDHEFGTRCQAQGARVVYDPNLWVASPIDPRCVTHRYFTRWSFKAGIARTGGIQAAGRRPQVPLWMVRRWLQDTWALMWHYDDLPNEAFARRLRWWRDSGAMANAWHGWLHPRRHAQWVAERSQKKNGLY